MKIKNYFLALLALPISAFGQEKELSCSQMKSKHVHAKSNNLSIAQIAETEKYDVHYYFLDLNMTNLNTSISGATEIHASARQNLDSAIIELFDTFVISDILVDGLSVGYDRTNSAITIPVNKLANENFVIRVVYAGTPPNASTNPLGGGGMTNDTSPSWGNQVTWSLSEPYSAYEWFPVKQSLKDKTDSCAVFITVPTACKAGSKSSLGMHLS